MSTITEKELLEEIRSIRKTLEHIEALLEERLIGVEEPLPDEIEEIEKYEAEKREGKLEPIKLNELQGTRRNKRENISLKPEIVLLSSLT